MEQLQGSDVSQQEMRSAIGRDMAGGGTTGHGAMSGTGGLNNGIIQAHDMGSRSSSGGVGSGSSAGGMH